MDVIMNDNSLQSLTTVIAYIDSLKHGLIVRILITCQQIPWQIIHCSQPVLIYMYTYTYTVILITEIFVERTPTY